MRSLFRALLLLLLLAPAWIAPAAAVFVEEKLDDPTLEARARDISAGIRCLVCQNQSILDSNADLAKDLRQIVRERVAIGESDTEVRGYLVTRYGDWVLLDPPFKLTTLLLWLGPAVIFILGAIAAIVFLLGRNRRPDDAESAGLSPQEEAEIDRLLDPEGHEQKS